MLVVPHLKWIAEEQNHRVTSKRLDTALVCFKYIFIQKSQNRRITMIETSLTLSVRSTDLQKHPQYLAGITRYFFHLIFFPILKNYYSIPVCACVHVYIGMWLCKPACVCAEASRGYWVTRCLLPYFFECLFEFGPRLTATKPQQSSCLCTSPYLTPLQVQREG